MCVFTGRFKVCVCTGCCIRVCAQVWCPGIMLSGFVGFLFYYIPDVLFKGISAKPRGFPNQHFAVQSHL